ncbi:MAG: bifunctional homocysteine S-methyltransferase/methylenetetrahydrofolate reductase [Victivallales bacterium]|nr:bifunctional homocysteine S-methyltransferase/methylenetetrahydrofolate reductase [Victivallales bacterium]
METPSLQHRLQKQILVFDGAMGTEIYRRNFFTNRNYDELCLSAPDIIGDIHRQYVQAGADVLTTNSFGANPFALRAFGFGDKAADICRQSAVLARQAAEGHDILIAGSIGPLPDDSLTPITREQRLEALQLMIRALADGGADFIIFETLATAAGAIAAIQAMTAFPDLAFIVSFALPQGANQKEILPFLVATATSGPRQPAALGLNCGLGPDEMLSAVETAVHLTSLPLVVQPNSGAPHSIDHRQLYLCSPEYLSTYAVRYVNLGARAVGGCCGTTPDHIADLARSVKPLGKHATLEIKPAPSARKAQPQAETPLAERSRLGRKLCAREWINTVEILPPLGWDTANIVEKARICQQAGIDTINVPDGPRAAPRLSALVTGQTIQREAGIEAVVHVCARDRSFVALQADLLGCAAAGLKNLLFITGDPPKLGNYSFSSGVFDTDSIGLSNLQKHLNQGLDLVGQPVNPKTSAVIGVGADPSALDFPREIARLRAKVEAGANYVTTQPVFDLDALKRFCEAIADLNLPVIAGIWPFASLRNALFMKNEVPGVIVPDKILERMEKAGTKEEQLQTGVDIAQEMLSEIRDRCAGVQVSAPLGNLDAALRVLGK